MTVLDGDPFKGFLRERSILKALYSRTQPPRMAMDYARGISKATGIPLEKVLESEPFKSFQARLKE